MFRRLDAVVAAGSAPALKRLSLNALLQIGSQVLPLAAGVIAIPVLHDNLGAAEFGTFTVALSVLGLFALLDLGLGRSTVRFVAQALADADAAKAASVTLQSALILGGVALALAALLTVSASALAEHWFEDASGSQRALRLSLYVLAAALPFTALMTVLRSVLEAYEDFRSVGAIQTTIGVAAYLVPVVVSFFTTDVHLVIAGAAACRVAGFLLFLMRMPTGWRPQLRRGGVDTRPVAGFREFSFWLVVSNLVGVCIVYADRALLVSLVPLEQVPLYNVPLELLGRVLIVVNGAVTVLFPWMARSGTNPQTGRYHAIALNATALVLGMPLLMLSVLAPAWLDLWLGEEFSRDSTVLVRIIVVGILFQGLNAVALAAANAQGQARTPAFMHLFEMPLYLAALYVAGTRYGLPGIAVVWAVRPLFEYLCYAALLALKDPAGSRSRALGMVLAACNGLPAMLVLCNGRGFAMLVWLAVAAATVAWISTALRAIAARASDV